MFKHIVTYKTGPKVSNYYVMNVNIVLYTSRQTISFFFFLIDLNDLEQAFKDAVTPDRDGNWPRFLT